MKISLRDRIAQGSQIEDCGYGTPCWVWNGTPDRGGYARASFNGRRHTVHRVSYEVHVGPIPADLVLDHLCRNRACVNPHHLEPVTNEENVRRGLAGEVAAAANLAKEMWPKGHPYAEFAMNRSNGARQCKVCSREWSRQYRLKQKASPALCTVCDARLTDTAIRACSLRDCPNAQRDAA